MLPRGDNWYAGLFSPSVGQIAGDITPAYAFLDKSVVARIRALMPAAKVIYLLRNPIDRIWSQVAFFSSHLGYRDIHTLSGQAIPEFMVTLNKVTRNSDFVQSLDPGSSSYSDYARSLDTWESYYPGAQVFVGFFDQLVGSPGDLLREILGFLELPASGKYIPACVDRKVNASQYPAIPPQFGRHLARRQYENIQRLHQRFANRYTAGWLRYAQEVLEA